MKWSVLPVLASLVALVNGDIGKAGHARPPYIPNDCHLDAGQLPPPSSFVSVNGGLWDNGAACGRRVKMRCISGPKGACKAGTIDLTVVDNSPSGPSFTLPDKAWDRLVNGQNIGAVNIEYVWM